MDTSDIAQNAYAFYEEFTTQILRQIDELNVLADGALQDGYNAWHMDDGWIALKGFSWGFVIHYDAPVRIDMTFGPGWPFVGYQMSFIAHELGGGLAWVNQNDPNEVCFDAQQLARYGLRKLAVKAGDSWLFEGDYSPVGEPSTYIPQHHDSFREHL